MTNFAARILPHSIGDAVSEFTRGNPLLGSGVTALAARWAMRSGPAAIALVGAGLLYRYLRHNRAASPAESTRRTRAARTKSSPRKAAKPPRAKAA